MDPNNTKQGRGSVFIKTITLGCTSGDTNSRLLTYIVAVGPKGVNHDEVEEIHAKEMNDLRNESHYFYSKAHGKVINLHAELFVSLADQPARREANGISAGNGTYGGRWGHCVNLGALSDVVPSCDDCLEAMLSGDDVDPTCGNCTNWETVRDCVTYSCFAFFTNQCFWCTGRSRKRRGAIRRTKRISSIS